MKENKYYVPKIEEFHVGFEYVQDEGGWYPKVVESDFCSVVFEHYIDSDKIRVKHLNEKDILSLGLVRPMKEQAHHVMYLGNFKRHGHDVYMTFYEVEQYITFEYLSVNFSDPIVIFSGVIQNKSELMKIIEQLNIIIK